MLFKSLHTSFNIPLRGYTITCLFFLLLFILYLVIISIIASIIILL